MTFYKTEQLGTKKKQHHAKSIIKHSDGCFWCGSTADLEEHHCLHGPDRKLAEADGLTVMLCRSCHQKLHDKGENDETFEAIAEYAWIKKFCAGMPLKDAIEAFRARYRKNYL